MARPTLITVTGTYLTPSGPESGTVEFISNTFVRDSGSDDVMTPGTIVGTLDDAGELSMQVPATDDPAFSPVGWTYKVVLRFGDERPYEFDAVVPYDAPAATLKLSSLLPAQPGGSELYAPIAHTHPDDVSAAELTTALSGYPTLAQLTTALAAYLQLTGGTITGNLTVQGAGGTKSYGFRTNGSNLDLEAAGADLFLSVWSGAGATGTQRNYARLEAGAALAHALGRWVWASTAFASTFVLDVDPSTGVVVAGGKNSLAGIRLCGYKATAGAPTTGTWAVGDVVVDSAGAWHMCTTAGTPGTWT